MSIETRIDNIFNVRGDVKLVTTNGVTKANGAAVMGAGFAKNFCKKFGVGPSFVLGDMLNRFGNTPHKIHLDKQFGEVWYSFPTKYHYKDLADIELIIRSIQHIESLYSGKTVVTVTPGCGLGGLSWRQVMPIMEDICVKNHWIVVENRPWKI